MKYIIFAITISSLVSCNKQIYPSYKSETFQFNKDSIVLMLPKYQYYELANSEPQDKKYWKFSNDTSLYFQVFNQELFKFFRQKTNVEIKTYRTLLDETILNSFSMLSRGSFDSVNAILQNLKTTRSNTKHKTAYLVVDFVVDKVSGSSGLGPMGSYTKAGMFDIYLMILHADTVVSYTSMRRFPSFFNRGYNSKRSKRAIRAFFKRI